MKGSLMGRGAKTWRLRYDGPPGPDGTRRQVAETYHGNRKQADQRLRELLRQVETGGFVEPSTDTVAAYLARWLSTYAATNCTARTVQQYKTILNGYIIPAIGGIRLQALQPAHVQQVYADLLGRGLSARTVLGTHRVLSEALKQAVKWELAIRNVCDAVTAPRSEHTEAPVWNDATLQRFLQAAKGHPFRDFYLLAVLTGARRSELCGLKWDSVDLTAARLMIVETRQWITGKGIVVGKPKTAKSRRTVSLDPDAVNLLREIRGKQMLQAGELGEVYEQSGYVFTTPRGLPVDPNTVTQGFTALVRKAGLPHLTLHGLRHVHATRLLQRGVHAKIVSERLGHSNIAITLDTYSHVLPGLQESAIAALGKIFDV